jgi:hypothetical protein
MAIVISGLVDAAIFGTCCGIIALSWFLLLREKYRRDRMRASRTIPAHRLKLDRIVAWYAMLLVLPATSLCAFFAFGLVQPLSDDLASGAIAALVLAGTAIWTSSLFDWYVILPRISGQLGARPCRSGTEAVTFSFPSTWREVTRWWYVHRVVAEFVFRSGASVALVLIIGEILDLQQAALLVAAAATMAFGVYLASSLPHGVRQAGHVNATVGQTIRVDSTPVGRRTPWLFKGVQPLRFHGRYYVVDVAVNGVQVVGVEPHETEAIPRPPNFERHSSSVSNSPGHAVQTVSPVFRGCEERCSGINWYCIENPRCFEAK